MEALHSRPFFSCCLQSHNLGHKRLRPQKISPRRILHVTKITPGRNLFAVGQPLQSSAAVTDDEGRGDEALDRGEILMLVLNDVDQDLGGQAADLREGLLDAGDGGI